MVHIGVTNYSSFIVLYKQIFAFSLTIKMSLNATQSPNRPFHCKAQPQEIRRDIQTSYLIYASHIYHTQTQYLIPVLYTYLPTMVFLIIFQTGVLRTAQSYNPLKNTIVVIY